MDRRRKKRIRINPKYLLIAAMMLCIGLLFVSYRYPSKVKPLRIAVAKVISPMQRGINTIGRAISRKLDNLADINDLINENIELKEELDQLKYDYKMTLQDNNELAAYRNLYDLDQKYVTYPKVAARIISRDTNNIYNSFTIDKGSNQGIAIDMNVLAGNGLVGIVTDVMPDTATVCSIIDDSCALSGMFMKSSDTCIVSGSLESMSKGYINVSMISLNADAEENAEIVTSHISDKYHQGILVGYAVNIEVDSSNMMKKARLIPAVDFEHLDTVLIITELK